MTEDKFINDLLNNANELIELEKEVIKRNNDFDTNNKNDRTCIEIDEWFNGLLKEQLKRGVMNDQSGSKAVEEKNPQR